MSEKKELEYPDAPSGYVTLHNYKEPFMPFRDDVSGQGFGYEGVLLFDGETDKVQCHFCGQFFIALGNHLHKEHNMLATDYKKQVGLRQTTALIGEKMRVKLISAGQERFKNLRPGKKKTEAEKKKISNTLKNLTRQAQNITGTCPAQIIERIKIKARELGRCPTERELGYFYKTVVKVYGTFREACIVAGLKPLAPGQTLRVSKFTKDYFLPIIQDFWIKNGRMPKYTDFKTSKNHWAKYKKFQKDVEKTILFKDKKYHKLPVKIRYSDEDLLSILRTFVKTNQREPSTSDCKRGLLPHASNYYYHFGGLKKAIEKL